jgi:predicted DNA-binding ribbon-helix-helix protein
MSSTVVKRSIVIAGHKTSVSLEDAFWQSLKQIAAARGTTLSEVVGLVDVEHRQGNLSSCLRLFVLDFYRDQLREMTRARDTFADPMTAPPAKSA